MAKIILVILAFWVLAGLIILGIRSLNKDTFNVYGTIVGIILLAFLLGSLILFTIVAIF